jgi:histone H3/H4
MNVDPIIPAKNMYRLIKAHMNSFSTSDDLKLSKGAFNNLREAAEAELYHQFTMAQSQAIHAKRITIEPNDMRSANALLASYKGRAIYDFETINPYPFRYIGWKTDVIRRKKNKGKRRYREPRKNVFKNRLTHPGVTEIQGIENVENLLMLADEDGGNREIINELVVSDQTSITEGDDDDGNSSSSSSSLPV